MYMSAHDWLLEYLERMRHGMGGELSAHIEAQVGEWWHACPWRLHELLELNKSPSATRTIRDLSTRLLEELIAHLEDASFV